MKKENLVIHLEGTLEEFLGVNTNRRKDGSIYLTQPHLIEHTVNDLGQEIVTLRTSQQQHSHPKSYIPTGNQRTSTKSYITDQ